MPGDAEGGATTCVVCGRNNTRGEQRRSGFKCLDCIGKRSKKTLRRQVGSGGPPSEAAKPAEAAVEQPTQAVGPIEVDGDQLRALARMPPPLAAGVPAGRRATLPPAESPVDARQRMRAETVSTNASRTTLPPVPQLPQSRTPVMAPAATPALTPPDRPLGAVISPTRTGGIVPLVTPELRPDYRDHGHQHISHHGSHHSHDSVPLEPRVRSDPERVGTRRHTYRPSRPLHPKEWDGSTYGDDHRAAPAAPPSPSPSGNTPRMPSRSERPLPKEYTAHDIYADPEIQFITDEDPTDSDSTGTEPTGVSVEHILDEARYTHGLGRNGDLSKLSASFSTPPRSRRASRVSVKTPVDCSLGPKDSTASVMPQPVAELESFLHATESYLTSPLSPVPPKPAVRTPEDTPLQDVQGGLGAAHPPAPAAGQQIFDQRGAVSQQPGAQLDATPGAVRGDDIWRLSIPPEYLDRPQMSDAERRHNHELREAYLKGRGAWSPPSKSDTSFVASGVHTFETYRPRREVSV